MSEEFGSTEAETGETLCDHRFAVLEAVAKEIMRGQWHGDPERPFSDEAWERELKWHRNAPDCNWLAGRCLKTARAALLALAECALPEAVKYAGARSYWDSEEVEEIDVSCIDDMQGAFQAMLLALASPPTSGERNAPPNADGVA